MTNIPQISVDSKLFQLNQYKLICCPRTCSRTRVLPHNTTATDLLRPWGVLTAWLSTEVISGRKWLYYKTGYHLWHNLFIPHMKNYFKSIHFISNFYLFLFCFSLKSKVADAPSWVSPSFDGAGFGGAGASLFLWVVGLSILVSLCTTVFFSRACCRPFPC